MNEQKLKGIASALGRCELSPLERQFLGRVRDYFEEKGQLTEQQESILQGIYRDKLKRINKPVQ
jgi:hypothetical protein